MPEKLLKRLGLANSPDEALGCVIVLAFLTVLLAGLLALILTWKAMA